MADQQLSTLAQLKTLRDGLLADLGNGVATITDQNGESVTYTSPMQIMTAIREFERRISAIENATRSRPAGCYSIETSRGL